MPEKTDTLRSAISEMYAIAAELTISGDKTTQGYGRNLRKLVEQVEMEFARRMEDVN